MRLNIKSRFAKGSKAKPKGKDKLWTLVKNHYDWGIEARKPLEQRWIIQIAFLMGRQYSFFNRTAHTLHQLKKQPYRIRNVDNQLLGRWRRQVADLIRTDPELSVVPNTNEDEDIKAAKVGTKVIQSFWQSARMKGKQRRLGGWIYATGNGFLDDRWNPRMGPTSLNKKGELVYEGDVDAGVWSPFEIVVPSIAMGPVELHEFPWLDKVKWRNMDWIRSNLKRGEEVKSEGFDKQMIDLTMLSGAPSGTTNKLAEGALVHNFYLQPNHDFPKGKYVVAANGIVDFEEDYPFRHYHLEHFKDIEIPGLFWGLATLGEAIGLQKTWNRTISWIDEFNRVMGKGKWLIPKGSNIEIAPDDTHGEMMNYNPVMGHKPEHLTLKGLPTTYQQILEWTKLSFDDLFSQHEVSRGTNKSDIRSGEMVSILREQDATGAIPSHAVYEESLEAFGGKVLKRVQSGYTTERTVKLVGREGEYDVFAFKGADLRGNTDVKVKKQSSLPDSQHARQAQVLERFGTGLYGDPADAEVRRNVMNMLDDAVVKDIYADTRLDEAYARYENRLLMDEKGADQYLINDYDNDGIHLREHNHFRKGLDYQKVKVANLMQFTALESRFTAHVQMHQKRIEEMIQKQLKQQAMLKGGEK